MSEDTVTVIVTDEDGTEVYRADHAALSELSFARVSVTFDPELPPINNGQTLRVEHADHGTLIESRA